MSIIAYRGGKSMIAQGIAGPCPRLKWRKIVRA